jgi:hypothetical protein
LCCVLAPNPHEDPILLVDGYALGVDDLVFQVVEGGVIQGIAAFERTVRYPSLALQEVDNLGKHLVEGHG